MDAFEMIPSFKWKILEKVMESMFSDRATEYGNIIADIFYEYDKQVLQIFRPTCILSGSIGEGMPIYNDIDFMMFQKDMLITEVDDSLTNMISKCVKQTTITSGKILFKMDCGECYHGFTRLELISNIVEQGFKNHYCEKYNGKIYLSADKYFQEYNKASTLQLFRQLTHHKTGPALTFSGWDYVFAIAASDQLGFSEGFLDRIPISKYKSNLSADMLRKIRVCVVPKAHEGSCQSCLEFRLSFSLLERVLIKYFTREQKIYYCLLKSMSLKNIKKNKKGFTSYHLKNLMFWTISEEDVSFWKRPMMEVLPCLLFKKLKSYIEIGCPNYFIKGNKMILHYSEEELHNMTKTIDEFQKHFWEKIVFSKKLGSNFFYYFFEELKKASLNDKSLENMFHQCKMIFKMEYIACRCHIGFFVTSVINTLPKCHNAIITILKVFCTECDLKYPYEVIFNCRVIQQRQLCLLLFDEVEKCKDDRNFHKAEVLNGFLCCIMLLSNEMVGALDDQDIGGNILLGLFLYVNKDFRKAQKIFKKVAGSKTWVFKTLFVAMPLPFLNVKPSTPRYFRNDKNLSRLFWEETQIYLEPVSFALYLLINITDVQSQKKMFQKKLRQYQHWIKYIDRLPYKFVEIYDRMVKTI